MIKTCPICGVKFEAPPSERATCSRACGGKLSGRSRTGKPHRWSAEARAIWAKRPPSPNLRKGTIAARQSPISGPFETNQEAKIWHLKRLSDGRVWVVRNLAKFCRDHPELFAPTSCRNAYAGLRQVQASLTGRRGHGNSRAVSRYKGWTLLRPAQAPEDANSAGKK